MGQGQARKLRTTAPSIREELVFDTVQRHLDGEGLVLTSGLLFLVGLVVPHPPFTPRQAWLEVYQFYWCSQNQLQMSSHPYYFSTSISIAVIFIISVPLPTLGLIGSFSFCFSEWKLRPLI